MHCQQQCLAPRRGGLPGHLPPLPDRAYASQNGSGVRASRLYDSLIVFNTGLGAVAYSQSTNDVVNCTIARNSSKALEQASAANSIIVENGSTANQGNYYVAHCLIDFTPTSGYGLNNITGGGARFVDSANGDFRLLADSPAHEYSLNSPLFLVADVLLSLGATAQSSALISYH